MMHICDYFVTQVPIGLGFGTALGFGLGLRGPDLGLGLDNNKHCEVLVSCSGRKLDKFMESQRSICRLLELHAS